MMHDDVGDVVAVPPAAPYDQNCAEREISDLVRELGVRYRGVTNGRYLSFDRLDKSESLNAERAQVWAKRILETIIGVSDADRYANDVRAFVEAHEGLTIA